MAGRFVWRDGRWVVKRSPKEIETETETETEMEMDKEKENEIKKEKRSDSEDEFNIEDIERELEAMNFSGHRRAGGDHRSGMDSDDEEEGSERWYGMLIRRISQIVDNSLFDDDEDFDENIESYFQSLIDRITNIRDRYLEYQDSLEHHRAYGKSHEKAAEEMKFLNGIKFFDLFKNTCKSGSRCRIVINLLRIYELYHLDTYDESELRKSIDRLLSK